ncbi:MAG TPA: transglycosylase family protein [Solirubrobacterales bacterium]|nr:transglycosylase family protein [Solirubrobacterales bacterium]
MRRVVATTLFLTALLATASAWGADIGVLRDKVGGAREEAASLGAQIRDTQERLLATEAEAAAAASRERHLSDLLAHGRERAARLSSEVEQTERDLAVERSRLRRARRALAQRLVAIYESGTPSTASIVLGAGDFDELATRTEYLQRIEDSDTELAARVEQVRNVVRHELELVAALKARVDAYNERLAAARSEIAAVRSRASATAARLDALAATRSESLATLKSRIGEWVVEIETAEAASRAAAEETVGRWLGGPYSIPTYIVMCESGGNYGALNPSSGAGGAYQILPSTWDLYGGQGSPQSAPKAEQDRIAAEIWADSGGSAWVCAG